MGCNGVIDILLEPLDGGRTDTRQGDRVYARTENGALAVDAPGWPEWLVDALEGPTAELLESPVPCIGPLGPRERVEEIREECRAEGREFTDAELERIYTPAGLDLGGGTPFHTAQSIAAEVTAVRHGREPKHLREPEGHIHERPSIEQ